MLDMVWKRISDKRPAGRKLIPIVLGLSGAMWLGAGATFLILKEKAPGAAKADGPAREADGKAELAGVPATAEGAEAAEDRAPAAEGAGDAAEAHGPAAATAAEGAPGNAPMPDPEGGEDPQLIPTRAEAEALRQVAELRVANGQSDQAVAPLRRLLLIPTREAALLSLASKVFLATGNYAEALRFAGELAAVDPDDMEARVRMAEAQYRLGDVAKAMRAAEDALKAHPGDLAMLVELGTMQVEMGPGRKGYGEALAEALKRGPDYAPALYLAGRKAQLEGDYKDAETAFAKAVKRDPANPKALGQLGIAQYHLGKRRQAEKSFRSSLAQNPADYNTWYNLGELLLGYANDETSSEAVRRFRAEAMECYLKAIELNPDHAQARYRVGVLLIGNGQYKEAIRHLEASLRLDARHVPTLLQLSLAYENLKQPERARAYLTKAYELDPLNKVVLFKLRRLS